MSNLFEMSPRPPSEANIVSILALTARIALALIFVLSGVSKLTALDDSLAYINSVGLPLPQVGLAIAIIVEIACGSFLLIGQFTRLAAFALAVFTLVTAVVFHSAISEQAEVIHLMKNIAIAGGLLQVVAFGPGRLSLDERLFRA